MKKKEEKNETHHFLSFYIITFLVTEEASSSIASLSKKEAFIYIPLASHRIDSGTSFERLDG